MCFLSKRFLFFGSFFISRQMGNSSIIYVTVNTDVQKKTKGTKINRRKMYMKNAIQWNVYGCYTFKTIASLKNLLFRILTKKMIKCSVGIKNFPFPYIRIISCKD